MAEGSMTLRQLHFLLGVVVIPEGPSAGVVVAVKKGQADEHR